MAAVTINNYDLTDEASFRNRLISVNAELRNFRARSRPALRTAAQWEWFYQKQANAVWLEDSLIKMQRSRQKTTITKRRTVKEALSEEEQT